MVPLFFFIFLSSILFFNKTNFYVLKTKYMTKHFINGHLNILQSSKSNLFVFFFILLLLTESRLYSGVKNELFHFTCFMFWKKSNKFSKLQKMCKLYKIMAEQKEKKIWCIEICNRFLAGKTTYNSVLVMKKKL